MQTPLNHMNNPMDLPCFFSSFSQKINIQWFLLIMVFINNPMVFINHSISLRLRHGATP